MIFYFTGTGNSRHVAERIGSLIGDGNIKNIADYYNDVVDGKGIVIDVDSAEPLGFVCPVHSWGPDGEVVDASGWAEHLS